MLLYDLPRLMPLPPLWIGNGTSLNLMGQSGTGLAPVTLGTGRSLRKRRTTSTPAASKPQFWVCLGGDMATTQQSTKCAHPQCPCPVSSGEQFCSPACAANATQATAGKGCGCEHSDCLGASAVA